MQVGKSQKYNLPPVRSVEVSSNTAFPKLVSRELIFAGSRKFFKCDFFNYKKLKIIGNGKVKKQNKIRKG
jgi:hypothetical protein